MDSSGDGMDALQAASRHKRQSGSIQTRVTSSSYANPPASHLDTCHVCGRNLDDFEPLFDCPGGNCCMECPDVFFVSDMMSACEACKTCMSWSETIRLEGQDKPAGVWEHAVQRLHCVPCRKACAFMHHNGSDWVSPSSSLPCRLPYRPSVSRRSSRPPGTAPSPDVPGSGRLSRRLCPRGIPFRTRCSETLLRSETALLSACTLASQPVHGTKTGPPNE